MREALGRTPNAAPAVGEGELDQRVTADFGGAHLPIALIRKIRVEE